MSNLELILIILAILGGLDLSGRGIKVIAKAFPPFLTAQARFWKLMADIFSTRLLGKRATVARIEEVVNQTAFQLQKNLPKGWSRRARISWVRRPQPSQFREGDLILRIRPFADSDHTLMNALWMYFNGLLFPDNRDIIPNNLISSTALAITRSGLEESHPYLVSTFDDAFLTYAKATDQDQINLYADCSRLNEIGLLMGPFVREIDRTATISRFRGRRNVIERETRNIIDHMLSFQPLMNINKPESQWRFHGEVSNYSFILVSRPPATRPDIQAYIRRAEEHISHGVSCIYVIGRLKERDFVLKVVEAILSLRQLKGIELFPLLRDYRGDPGGLGATIGLDPVLAPLTLTPRPIALIEGSDSGTQLPAEKMPILVDSSVLVTDQEEPDQELQAVVDELAVRLSDYEGAWIPMAAFGAELRSMMPTFTPESYGERNLISVLKKLPELEIDERGKLTGRVFVRLRGEYCTPQQGRDEAIREAGARIAQILNEYAPGSWIFLGQVGFLIKRYYPEFNHKRLGFSTLHEFIEAVESLEVDERGEGYSKTYVRVR